MAAMLLECGLLGYGMGIDCIALVGTWYDEGRLG